MIIGYTTGVYDLFHIGHLNLLFEQVWGIKMVSILGDLNY